LKGAAVLNGRPVFTAICPTSNASKPGTGYQQEENPFLVLQADADTAELE
jgi:hypothetical protein